MKKLSLKSLGFTSNERLQKEQLKSLFGGHGGYQHSQCTKETVIGSTNGMDGVYITC
jgi:hypothetical protein